MSNELAKNLSIELVPFCVKSEDFTAQQIQDILDRGVALGAKLDEAVSLNGVYASVSLFRHCQYRHWGVDSNYETLTDNLICDFNDTLLTPEQALDYLQLVEVDGRLVGKETVEEAFIPWEGGEMPVAKGTMVHVKYRNGEESVVTAGLCVYEEGFGRVSGGLYARDWSTKVGSASIVAYKVVDHPNNPVDTPVEPPVSSPEESSVFDSVVVGSALERALELVLAVYNGDEAKLPSDTEYDGDNQVHLCVLRLVEVESFIKAWGSYTLKSEDFTKEKEVLDKEIEEAQNTLSELIERKELLRG